MTEEALKRIEENLKSKENFLDLTSYQITEEGIELLARCTHLKGLLLSSNSIQNISFLNNLTQLQVLSINTNLIQDISPLINLIPCKLSFAYF